MSVDTATATARQLTVRPLWTPSLLAALAWLAVVGAAALLADLLPIAAFDAPVGPPSQQPFAGGVELLGTDSIGRSVLSRLVFGARISIAVGLGSVLLAAVLGGLLGLLAAYLGGAVASVIGVVTDAMLAFPPLLLLLAIAAVVRPGVGTLVVSLGLLAVPAFTRLAKANALSQLGREYLLAARAMGAGHGRLLFRELLPNCVPAIASYGVVMTATMIVIEGALSFLGVGIPPPAPSWGAMIATGKDYLYLAPWLVLVPCVVMFATILALNVVGERLRARFDHGADAVEQR
jgi:peptide/nickel transport system permease protein